MERPAVTEATAATTDAGEGADPEVPVGRRRTAIRVLAVIGFAAFAAFWIWALFFASKEARNRIDDREWAAAAEQRCAVAADEREALADRRRLDADDPAMLAERAAIVDRATDTLERMLDDIVAVPPSDDKGRALVPQWEADYRTYLADRRDYADVLRTGADEPFLETAVDGIPLSDKLTVFAGDNSMPSCAPPTDLS